MENNTNTDYIFLRETFWDNQILLENRVELSENMFNRFLSRRKQEVIALSGDILKTDIPKFECKDVFVDLIMTSIYACVLALDSYEMKKKEGFIKEEDSSNGENRDFTYFINPLGKTNLDILKSSLDDFSNFKYFIRTMFYCTSEDLLEVESKFKNAVYKICRYSNPKFNIKNPDKVIKLRGEIQEELCLFIENELKIICMDLISSALRKDPKYKYSFDKNSYEISINKENIIRNQAITTKQEANDILLRITYRVMWKLLDISEKGYGNRLYISRKYKDEISELKKQQEDILKESSKKDSKITELENKIKSLSKKVETFEIESKNKKVVKVMNSEDREEKKNLTKQINELTEDLDNISYRNKLLEKQIENLCKQNGELENKINLLKTGDPITYMERFIFVGGRLETIQILSSKFKNSKFIDNQNVNLSASKNFKCDCVFYLTKNVSHSQVSKIKNIFDKQNVPFYYINSRGVGSILNDIREHYYKSGYREITTD